MAKIAQVSSKYIVHATIEIEGVVDRPDVIGAIFGQTEGLLGSDLELRELQRSGRIGRIEVNVDTSSGKTKGTIVVPSSLDKAETSIIGASLEIIERIGPCNAKIRVQKIEDVRVSKRNHVVERAKELLKNLMEGVLPDSQEIAEEVVNSVRIMEITEYGKDRLPAGPVIEESEEIIVVEGRADVTNLLRHGFKNVIAMNGTSVPQTIIELSHKKGMTVFVDGDRGGDLIIKELLNVAEIDFVVKAPDGKEVEEITKKEIHKALRGKMPVDQAKHEISTKKLPPQRPQRPQQQVQRRQPMQAQSQQTFVRKSKLKEEEKKTFKSLLEDLVGTQGAYILDEDLNILGKVPITELASTVKSLSSGIYAIIFSGTVEKELVQITERAKVQYLVTMESKIKPEQARVNILTMDDL